MQQCDPLSFNLKAYICIMSTVTFKHKDKADKILPAHYGEGILLSSIEARGYELVKTKKEAKSHDLLELSGLTPVRKGDETYLELIQIATDKGQTLEEIMSKYKISVAVQEEITILLK